MRLCPSDSAYGCTDFYLAPHSPTATHRAAASLTVGAKAAAATAAAKRFYYNEMRIARNLSAISEKILIHTRKAK